MLEGWRESYYTQQLASQTGNFLTICLSEEQNTGGPRKQVYLSSIYDLVHILILRQPLFQ